MPSLVFICIYLYFLTEDFTEELLTLHDAEIQQLKRHHNEHRELFDGVQQWEENWRLLLELEVSQLSTTSQQ